MAHWKHTLDVKDIWLQAEEKTISIPDFSREMAKRLAALNIHNDEELDNVIAEFEELITDSSYSWDDVDDALFSLYEWADSITDPLSWPPHRKCWVSTLI